MSGLLQMFYAPGVVFDDVREGRRTWIVPAIAVVLISTLMALTVIQMVGYENIVRKSIEGNKAIAERLGPAGVEDAIQKASSPLRRNLSYVMPGVGSILILLIVSGVLTAILAIMDSRPSFGKTLAMYSYSYFLYAVVTGLLSLLILSLMSDRADADLQHLVMFNLGAALDKETTNRFLYSLATSLDLISILNLMLVSFGLSRIAPGLTFGKALTAVGALWLVVTLIKAGFAQALGGLMG